MNVNVGVADGASLCFAMLSITLLALSDTYDTQFPHYAPGCAHGCAAWASAASANYSQATIDGYFIGGHAAATAAGTDCAMPGAQTGNHECDCGEKDGDLYMVDSYAGPWCFCAGADAKPDGTTAYCTPARSHAEQINVQLADATTVVVSSSPTRTCRPTRRLPCSACRRRRSTPP